MWRQSTLRQRVEIFSRIKSLLVDFGNAIDTEACNSVARKHVEDMSVGGLKMREWKMQEWKLRHGNAGGGK